MPLTLGQNIVCKCNMIHPPLSRRQRCIDILSFQLFLPDEFTGPKWRRIKKKEKKKFLSYKCSVKMCFHCANGLISQKKRKDILCPAAPEKYFLTELIVCCCLYESLLYLEEMVSSRAWALAYIKKTQTVISQLSI